MKVIMVENYYLSLNLSYLNNAIILGSTKLLWKRGRPTNPFQTLELRNPSQEAPELPKVHRSPRGSKIVKEPVGQKNKIPYTNGITYLLHSG